MILAENKCSVFGRNAWIVQWVNVKYFIPVETIPNFNEGGSENAYVRAVDGVVKNMLVVDDLLY